MAKPKSQDSPRLTLLKQELLKWEAFNRICKSEDYLLYLKPLLQQALNNKWPDPAQQDFDKKYIIEYSRAKAYEEIFNLMELAEGMIKNLRKQMDEPERNYEI
jgi:hypothetical protein